VHTPRPHADTGLFEPVLGRAPDWWPWALPHLYAVNYAGLEGLRTLGATATPDGQFLERLEVTQLGRFEVLGYWSGEFRVVHSEATDDIDSARSAAERTFAQLGVHALLHRGTVVRANPDVHVTGAWPASWHFERIQDLGVLCAFLYDCAKTSCSGEAERFRAMIVSAWPPTEQLIVYLGALRFAERDLTSCLPSVARTPLERGISAATEWLR
jgi:hypothetical protein